MPKKEITMEELEEELGKKEPELKIVFDKKDDKFNIEYDGVSILEPVWMSMLISHHLAEDTSYKWDIHSKKTIKNDFFALIKGKIEDRELPFTLIDENRKLEEAGDSIEDVVKGMQKGLADTLNIDSKELFSGVPSRFSWFNGYPRLTSDFVVSGEQFDVCYYDDDPDEINIDDLFDNEVETEQDNHYNAKYPHECFNCENPVFYMYAHTNAKKEGINHEQFKKIWKSKHVQFLCCSCHKKVLNKEITLF